MDKATVEKLTLEMRQRGYNVTVDETRRVTRITAKKAPRGLAGSLSHLTVKPEGKS